MPDSYFLSCKCLMILAYKIHPSFQKLMSDLEEKEKELNKLKAKVDIILKNQHPASDKIEVRKHLHAQLRAMTTSVTKLVSFMPVPRRSVLI